MWSILMARPVARALRPVSPEPRATTFLTTRFSTTGLRLPTTPTPPASVDEIGWNGAANHQYDIADFYTALTTGHLPAVSFLKAPAFQDGHAGYSDPLDEQNFVVKVINALQNQPTWDSTAVVIMYDDSDGWYDHQMGPIVNTSTGPSDALTGPGACGTAATALPGFNPANTHALGRCGYGPRLP